MIRITHFLHSSAISGNLPTDNLDTMTRTFNHIAKITTTVMNQDYFQTLVDMLLAVFYSNYECVHNALNSSNILINLLTCSDVCHGGDDLNKS